MLWEGDLADSLYVVLDIELEVVKSRAFSQRVSQWLTRMTVSGVLEVTPSVLGTYRR